MMKYVKLILGTKNRGHQKVLRFIFCTAGLVLLSRLFTSCSWQENFYVVNNTHYPCRVEMHLSEYDRGFSIFHYSNFNQYPVNSKSKINIEKPSPLPHDTIGKYNRITMLLPAFKALRIGTLNNQKYERYNQAFFNDRYFNLEKISISTGNSKTEIIQTEFDAFFKKENGAIKYFVAPR